MLAIDRSLITEKIIDAELSVSPSQLRLHSAESTPRQFHPIAPLRHSSLVPHPAPPEFLAWPYPAKPVLRWSFESVRSEHGGLQRSAENKNSLQNGPLCAPAESPLFPLGFQGSPDSWHIWRQVHPTAALHDPNQDRWL